MEDQSSKINLDTDIKNFKWKVYHDFSEIPEQTFQVITQLSEEVSISLTEEGKFRVSGPSDLCSSIKFLRKIAQKDGCKYSEKTSNLLNAGSPAFFKQCSCKNTKTDETWASTRGCTSCSATVPCRLHMVGYYKWL